MKTLFALLTMAALAAAQGKVSGTIECGKPDKESTFEIGDRPNHAYTITQGKCTWSKPMDFGGAQTKDAVFTNFAETTGEKMVERGYSIETLATGDAMHVRTQANTTVKDGKISSDGKWSILRATGKSKGLTASGTYKCSGTQEKITCDVEGEYNKAAASAKTKKK